MKKHLLIFFLVNLLIACGESDKVQPDKNVIQPFVEPEKVAILPLDGEFETVDLPEPYQVIMQEDVNTRAKQVDILDKYESIEEMETSMSAKQTDLHEKMNVLNQDLTDMESRKALKKALEDSVEYRQMMLKIAKEQMKSD